MDIVLIEPENPGNVGAVARVLGNFGFSNLVLVNPKIDHLSTEARNRAKHARDVLQSAKVIERLDLLEYDLIVGTTARRGTDYNIPRLPLTPEEFVELPKPVKTALVFGREGTGLTNKEIRECDFVVSIPTAEYSSLNLSHAVAIMLYMLTRTKNLKRPVAASRKEKDLLMEALTDRLSKMPFASDLKRQTQVKVWHGLIGKSHMTRREFFALMGFFRKL
jgi:tRNA/rRNA methyltransferase